MALSHRIAKNGQTLLIHLNGDFTFSENADFRLVVDEVVDSKAQDVQIDLSGLSRLDSAALSMLMLLRERVSGIGGTVSLIKPPAQIARVLEVVDFGKLFTIVS